MPFKSLAIQKASSRFYYLFKFGLWKSSVLWLNRVAAVCPLRDRTAAGDVNNLDRDDSGGRSFRPALQARRS